MLTQPLSLEWAPPGLGRPAWPRGVRGDRRPIALAPVAGRDGAFVVPTHPIHNAMRRGILTLSPSYEEEVRIRVNGQARTVRVHTRFPDRTEGEPSPPSHQANLLRTHLDLLDQAHRADRPTGFRYDLGSALDRMGYQTLEGGGFHPDSQAALRDRLKDLAGLQVSLDPGDGAETPLWRFHVLTGGTEGGPLDPETDWDPSDRRLLVVPGEWWSEIGLANYRLNVPRPLLKLPMDGQGNQVHRIALLLAAELAVWQRTERRNGARVLLRSVGRLLERSAVANLDRLLADTARRLNTAKRLREYLAGDGFADQGAFAILRQNGFRIDIRDEAAFWASGRRWVERFWEARLCLELSEPVANGGEVLAAVPLGDRPLATSPTATGEFGHGHWRV